MNFKTLKDLLYNSDFSKTSKIYIQISLNSKTTTNPVDCFAKVTSNCNITSLVKFLYFRFVLRYSTLFNMQMTILVADIA